MGNTLTGMKAWASPTDYPSIEAPSSIDPNYGFPEGRKPREVKATYEEVVAAGIPPEYQDYCVDYYMKYQKCRGKYMPLASKCEHDLHAWEFCRYQDTVIRMKEYERERRLIQRAKRRKAKGLSEEMGE